MGSRRVGDKLYAKDFSGKGKWIPDSVIIVTGPISYQLKTQTGHFIRHHSYHLRVRYLPDDNVTDPRTDYDDWLVSGIYTSPTTECPLNVSPCNSSDPQELTQSSVRRSSRIRNPMDRYTPVSTLKGGIKVIEFRLRIRLKDQSSGRGYITARPSHTH